MLTKYNVFRAEDSLTVVPIRSSDLGSSEISWFSALCSDDYQFLGIPDGKLRSNWEHCSKIVQNADSDSMLSQKQEGDPIDKSCKTQE